MNLIKCTIGGFTAAILGLHLLAACSSVTRPHTAKEFASTAVKVLNSKANHGGSGVILSSKEDGSIILTNRHVCKVVENGGWIFKEDERFAVVAYKPSAVHDLCIIKVKEDLGVNTVIAAKAPEKYTPATISGFPNLYPHVSTPGNFSGMLTLNLLNGYRACTDKDVEYAIKSRNLDMLLGCTIFKNVATVGPDIPAQLISALMMPGSSGSAVFDEHGEIGAVIFAGAPEGVSFGLAVPYSYIRKFIDQESVNMNWTAPVSKPLAFIPDEE